MVWKTVIATSRHAQSVAHHRGSEGVQILLCRLKTPQKPTLPAVGAFLYLHLVRLNIGDITACLLSERLPDIAPAFEYLRRFYFKATLPI